MTWLLLADGAVIALFGLGWAVINPALLAMFLLCAVGTGVAFWSAARVRRDRGGRVPATMLFVGALLWGVVGLQMMSELDEESGLILDLVGIALIGLVTLAVVLSHITCGVRAWRDASP